MLLLPRKSVMRLFKKCFDTENRNTVLNSTISSDLFSEKKGETHVFIPTETEKFILDDI